MFRISHLPALTIIVMLLVACSGATTPATATSGASNDTWITAELKDVRTGQSFRIADYNGQVVLVEAMAVWCTNCKSQQLEVKKLHEALGGHNDLVSIGLGIDPNESADLLRDYVDKNEFQWSYALAPSNVSRELANRYGAQFLNPTAVPMLVIDRNGIAHPLPFGVKNVAKLQELLQPYLK